MKIILFTHPDFIGSQSMPRFAGMIQKGIEDRGHDVEIWMPQAFFYRIPLPAGIKKWMGYIDQYVLFPIQIKKRVRKLSNDVLFVFADQALGPWVKLVKGRKHLVHCHDFLALRSALGEFTEHRTSWTGKIYQKFIRRGFENGKQFIAISNKTAADLKRLNRSKNYNVDVVYNGLNYPFQPLPRKQAIDLLKSVSEIPFEKGFILNVSGSQWYKNRKGLLEAYKEYLGQSDAQLPLVIIGAEPSADLLIFIDKNHLREQVNFLVRPTTEIVHAAYASATLFFYPSLEEGFGWPIIEAQACGCPVITTDFPPMNEVGGDAAVYIPRRGLSDKGEKRWAEEVGSVLEETINCNLEEREKRKMAGYENCQRFSTENAIDGYERIYKAFFSSEAQ